MARKLDLSSLDIERNVYYRENPAKFLQLKELVERNPKNYFHELNGKNQVELSAWISSVTPLLQDPFFKISTKCYWILHNLTEFPKCHGDNCDKVFNDRNVGLRFGYPRFCSSKCNNASQQTIAKSKATKLDRYGDEHYRNVDKSRATRYAKYDGKWQAPDTQAKKERTCLQNNGFKYIFSSPKFKEDMKKQNLELYGVEFVSQRPEVMEKILAKKLSKYGNKIGSQAKLSKMFTPEIRVKSAQTCLARYGVTNGGASAQAQLKARKRYLFEGINFDSSPELALFIWLRDNQISFSYHTGQFFEYEFEGTVCRYYPDFFLEDSQMWIELKGDQFFREDGTMFCPFKTKDSTLEQQEEKNRKYEAKHQCMLSNGVVILRNDDYKFAIDYVASKYGSDYLQKFRKRTS